MSRLVEVILRLHGAAAYALIFALPGLEASAFLGFLVPGELAVVLGGVLAFQGRVSLVGIGAVAIAGAIVGDSIGYLVGARWGHALFRTRLLRRLVRPERRQKAEDALRRRGMSAVILGRFTAVLRVMVPGLAGMARVPYRRFLAASVVGGVLWAGAFTVLGYAAGDAWRRVEHLAARASLLVGILAVLVVGAVIATRRISANEERIREWLQALAERPRVAALRERYAGQIRFLYRRLDPKEALGLYLTIGLVLSVAAGWAFGSAMYDILSNQRLVVVDLPLHRFVLSHRSEDLTGVMKALAFLGRAPVVVGLVAAAAAVTGRLARSVRPAGFVVVSVAGGEVLRLAVGALVGRPAPTGWLIAPPGTAFPSGHTVVAATLLGAVAFALSLPPARWSLRVWLWAAAAFGVLLVGLCAVYLAVAHPSDVAGGAALGAAWLAVCATGWRTWERVRSQPRATAVSVEQGL
ncbi:MAG TPA: VTT domain-containing protein [Actinomycetota bacterium]|nr:VTT domain-containing protein [Actinomycetota bacterium]